MLCLASRERGAWSDLLVYAEWATHRVVILSERGLPEYPPAARLVLLSAAWANDTVVYAAVFLASMAVIDAFVLLRLRRLARSTGREGGVVVWVLAPAMLGSVSWARFDMVAVATVAVAMTLQSVRARSALAVVAILVKAWPLVLLPTLVGGERRARTSALTVAAALLGFVSLGWVPGGTAFSWVSWASDRGIQIESLPGLALALSGLAGSGAQVSYAFGSWQIALPGSADSVLAAALLTLGVLAVCFLFRSGLRTSSDRIATLLATLTVTVVLLTSKVFSPQYLLWLVGPVAVLLTSHELRRPRLIAALVLLCAAATHAVYPLTYTALLDLHPVAVGLLAIRTVLLVGVATTLALELREPPLSATWSSVACIDAGEGKRATLEPSPAS
ncbi:MAG: glycosyltransferase 87 family protein [Sporichthyaceae bacterium]